MPVKAGCSSSVNKSKMGLLEGEADFELFDTIIHCYQINLGGCLKGIKQVNDEWTFAESECVSLCLHLARHVFVNHASLFHHLAENKIVKIQRKLKGLV